MEAKLLLKLTFKGVVAQIDVENSIELVNYSKYAIAQTILLKI
ncbi:unnamed protein product [Musa acuminata subsp. malaccensis]|uniref:(wild Malaysian banana) hypothetical protein n=1 Tax=Musa acuminata subsp. malaccensis TaxID=214687 RepID=A0A804IUZ9_MUSAM|nr:unnamed protein product [Musa acuminata subsp. malaccensis]